MDRSDALIKGIWDLWGLRNLPPYDNSDKLIERVRMRLQEWYRKEVGK